MRLAVIIPLALSVSSCVDLNKGGTGLVPPSLSPLGFVGFETQVEIDAGVAAVGATALADLTGDGVLDLAVAGSEGRLRVLVGQGQAGFVAGADLAVTLGASAIEAVDLDRDGDRDLVVASLVGARVDVFENDGAGNFSARPSVTTAPVPTSIAIADCNDDGVVDLLLSHFSPSLVEVFFGVGDGTFAPAGTLPMPSAGRSIGLSVAHVDGDAFSDVVVADTDHNQVVIYHGDSTGVHDHVTTIAVGAGPFGVAVGDFNGDGVNELAVSCVADETVEVYNRIGGGGFALLQTVRAKGQPTFATAGDVSGDGIDDLLVGMLRTRALAVFEGDALGGMPLGREVRLGTTGAPLAIRVGDVNADGRVDAIVGASGLDRINVFLGATGGLAGARHQDVGLDVPATFDLADFDRNGTLDLVAGGLGGERIAIHETKPNDSVGDGHAVFEPLVELELGDLAAQRDVYDVIARDVNGDGWTDVLVAVDGGVKLCLNQQTSPPTFAVLPANGVFAPGVAPRVLAAADVTGDGALDLVVAYVASAQIAIARGDGAGSFGAPTFQSIDGGPGGLAIADFDGDRELDVAVSLMNRAAVQIFAVDGDGAMSRVTEQPVGALPTRLSAADLNGDGLSDLVVSNGHTNDLSLLIKLPNGGFAMTAVPVGQGPTALLTEDLNRDGAVDILASSLTSSDFHVILGDGAGGVARALVFPGTYTASNAMFADLNGNGLNDLVVSGFETQRIVTFKNVSR